MPRTTELMNVLYRGKSSDLVPFKAGDVASDWFTSNFFVEFMHVLSAYTATKAKLLVSSEYCACKSSTKFLGIVCDYTIKNPGIVSLSEPDDQYNIKRRMETEMTS